MKNSIWEHAMTTMIEEIYGGKRGHYETIKENEKYSELIKELCDLNKKFEASLNDEQKEIYDKIEFIHMGLEAEATESHYIEGVKIGLRLGVEAYQ